VIDIEKLFKRFSAHVVRSRSAPFICTTSSANESWFRVELIPILWEFRYPPDSVATNYNYPNSKKKADLCVRAKLGDIVFELKSFVVDQDSNKKETYPGQIKRLEKLISHRSVLQVIAFTTFIGYSENRMGNYMDLFFAHDSWDILGPRKLIGKYPLYVAITSMTK